MTATLHCPAWCDGRHDTEVHRAILWADELDENPIAVSLFNADEALGYDDTDRTPEIALQVGQDEIWLSLTMASNLVRQLTEAIVKAAEATR